MTQHHDLHAWTENAITDVQRKAEAARAFGSGSVPSDPNAMDYVYGTGPGGPYLLVVIPGSESQVEAAAQHFATHDPEAVLRRCAADRKVLELHAPTTGHNVYGGTLPACSACGTPEEYPVRFPCPTVRAVAEGYGWTEATP